MLRHLIYKIKATGPITVAEYMKEVLTNPAKVRVGEPEDQAAPAASPGVSQQGCARRCPRVLRASSSGAFSRGRAIPQELEIEKFMSAGWLGIDQVRGSAVKNGE